MERLTGLDASFLYNETATLHMHTLKYTVLDVTDVPGGYSFARFVEELEKRLHLLPPFRRRVVPVPGRLHHPVWVEDDQFDLSYHVRRIGVPPPGRRGDMDEVIAEIASWPLDRRRPLWEIWVLEGLSGDGDRQRVGFLAKIHHTVADGVAAAALLANVMTPAPGELDPPPPLDAWSPERAPGRLRLVVDAVVDLVASFGRLPRLVRDTVPRLRAVGRQRRSDALSPPRPILDVPRTPFNGSLTPHRSFAGGTLSLSEVRSIRAAFGATVNDVVLTVVGGALRAWLDHRGALPDRSLVAGVPVAADAAENAGVRLAGNRVSNMFVSLCTDVADPVDRLRAVHDAAAAAKQVHQLLGGDLLEAWSEYTPPGLYSWAMRQYGRYRLADRHAPPINLVVSNVPGPRDPLFIAGGRMEGIWSVGPILEGIGLNVTVWSYGDDLNVGVIACREHIPDPAELVDAMAAVLADLAERAASMAVTPVR